MGPLQRFPPTLGPGAELEWKKTFRVTFCFYFWGTFRNFHHFSIRYWWLRNNYFSSGFRVHSGSSLSSRYRGSRVLDPHPAVPSVSWAASPAGVGSGGDVGCCPREPTRTRDRRFGTRPAHPEPPSPDGSCGGGLGPGLPFHDPVPSPITLVVNKETVEVTKTI